MRVLITGANGYIAKSLYESLKDSFEITRISRVNFDLTDRNQCDYFFKTCAGNNIRFDCVIHTAAVGGSRLKKDDDSVLVNNLKMYSNLTANERFFDRLIHFGSGAELSNPTDPYGLSKSIIAKLIQPHSSCLNLRIYGVFDENELDTRFIKSNMLRYINQKDFVLHEDTLMDFIHMEDLIQIVESFLNKQKNHYQWTRSVVNCVYTHKYKLSDILHMINKIDDHKVNVPTITRVADREDYCYIGDQDTMIQDRMSEALEKVYQKLKTT
tara:strand:- start:577 stop:1383 length:807 start_codon:yes stop_codon:yes gene_type:complete